MRRRVLVEAQAEADLRGAIEWYDDQRPGLGGEFQTVVQEALARLESSPVGAVPAPGSTRETSVHRIYVPRFPFAIVFLDGADEVRVIAVAHLKRRPRYWAR